MLMAVCALRTWWHSLNGALSGACAHEKEECGSGDGSFGL